MEMEKQKKAYKAHCLVLPYPTQGHINPMLQFCKRLQHKGVQVTLACTRFISNSMHGKYSGSIAVELISDGYDEGGRPPTESMDAYLKRFRLVGSRTIVELVHKLQSLGCPVDCVIYDAFLPWVLDVTKDLGLVGAVFFTQNCVVDTIYYHVRKGLLKLPLSGREILLPGLPAPFEPCDMPSFVYDIGSYPAALDMLVNQFSNVDKADWVLCNTFYKLEEEVVDWMLKLWPQLRTIGPTIPSMCLDKRIQDDKDYGVSLYKPNIDVCMKWLNDKPNGSVVYVSFGSLAQLKVEQMEEIALGLKGSKCYFCWVVRKSEEAKLPKHFVEETSKNGLVVTWCQQLEVLAHKALGCFVTHCGWNSTLEALSLGVPMVAMPQWSDQSTNAKCLMDFWQAGVKARVDENGIVKRGVIEYCIREVMEGERGKEIKRSAINWKNLAKGAVDEGGSSDKSINEFVAKLVHS